MPDEQYFGIAVKFPVNDSAAGFFVIHQLTLSQKLSDGAQCARAYINFIIAHFSLFVTLFCKICENARLVFTDEEHIKKMGLLLDALDDNDDVQNVYHNWEDA